MSDERVAWAELFPDELEARMAARPLVYLPLGLCEPHGPGAALGLDLLKAEALCALAARRTGGVVAPSQGYHVHESGYHARWLEEVIGEAQPLLTSIAPSALLYHFLYQLRAFANAGFRGALVVTGHAGGNERDLRLVATAFSARFPQLATAVRTDAELASPAFQGDHAGSFELSQLAALRPELVDFDRIARSQRSTGTAGTKFALGDDHAHASRERGARIVEVTLDAIAALADELEQRWSQRPVAATERLSFDAIEALWTDLRRGGDRWATANPAPGQAAVSEGSQWKPFERVRVE